MRASYKGHRFPPEIISHADWLYHRLTLSLRDVEDLLAERGIIIEYSETELSANGMKRLVPVEVGTS